MLRTKIAVCVFICLSIVTAGAIIHHGIKQDRYHYYMRQPIPEGEYRIYSDFEPTNNRYSYMPYLPREYVRIIETENGDGTD